MPFLNLTSSLSALHATWKVYAQDRLIQPTIERRNGHNLLIMAFWTWWLRLCVRFFSIYYSRSFSCLKLLSSTENWVLSGGNGNCTMTNKVVAIFHSIHLIEPILTQEFDLVLILFILYTFQQTSWYPYCPLSFN